MSLERLSASELVSRTQSGSLTVVELVQALLSRIHARQDIIHAWVNFDEEFIMSQARRLDNVPIHRRGPLHGLPVAVKDVFHAKGLPTEFGTSRYRGHQPDDDAAIIGILREAGCLILGKTVTTEFAMSGVGKETTNPHNREHTPGGSSSGSAAAVADFQVPFAIGTQTGGSTIQPASYCGIVGYKPTFGILPKKVLLSLVPTLDTPGFFARSVEDHQLVWRVLSSFFPPSLVTTRFVGSPTNLRVAWCRTPLWSQASPAASAALIRGVHALYKHGLEARELILPDDFGTVLDWTEINIKKEYSISSRDERIQSERDDQGRLDEYGRDMAKQGARISLEEYKEAVDGYARLRPLFDELFEDRQNSIDVILSISSVDSAPRGLGSIGPATFNSLWTSLHVPVVGLPGFAGSNNLPLGLSLIGQRYKDEHLLEAARVIGKIFELEANWSSGI